MKKYDPYIAMALEKGVDDALIIDTAKIFTAPWVRMKCRFGCSGYGKRLCCPPHTPDHDETRAVLDSYKHALLCHRRWGKGYKFVGGFNDIIVDLETAIFLDGYYKALGLGSGPCTLCKTCDTSGTCKNPERARPAMEAWRDRCLSERQGRTMPYSWSVHSEEGTSTGSEDRTGASLAAVTDQSGRCKPSIKEDHGR